MNFKVDMYVSQTCGACRTMKSQIEGTELEKYVNYKYIDDEVEGDRNIAFVKGKGFSSIPTTHIYNEKNEKFFTGYVPIQKLVDAVNEVLGEG